MIYILLAFVSIGSNAETGIVTKSYEHHLNGNLSEFWAQEYTGADLLRDELDNFQTKRIDHLVAVVDSAKGHGEWVKSLISNSRAGAALKDISITSFGNGHYDDLQSIYESNTKFLYLNQSFQWRMDATDYEFYELAKLLSGRGTIIITSAGNNYRNQKLVDDMKRAAARESSVFIVAAMDETGSKDVDSQVADEVLVSAPGGHFVRSYINDSLKSVDGAMTSAATPQVTSAMAAFTEITGYQPTKREIQSIFKKTSLKLRYDDNFVGKLGYGLLNTYKIGSVALKISAYCDNKVKGCAGMALADDAFFTFPKINLERIYSSWPECSPLKYSQSSQLNKIVELNIDAKAEKIRKLRELRSSLLLNPYQSEGWMLLACIYESEGFEINAQYYKNLSNVYIHESELE